MHSFEEIGDVKGKRVLVRADFNVPVEDGKVIDDYRIVHTLPLIDMLIARGAQVLLVSHIESEQATLQPIYAYLQKKYAVAFVKEYFPQTPDWQNLQEYQCVLFENLRNHPGEKENDERFAKHLATFGDLYINEAFSVSHREHASIVGVPQYLKGYAGPRLTKEVAMLTKVFNPPHPFLFVLGGAKFETKMPLLKKFYALADVLFIGGALANDFLKAKGLPVGVSLVSDAVPDLSFFSDEKIVLPIDVVVRGPDGVRTVLTSDVRGDEAILDVGPETLRMIERHISSSELIVWNGPLGNYEEGFGDATEALAVSVGRSSAQSIVGGGDTVAAIMKKENSDDFTFISTGGGAMLDFLANETLPGIEVLK